MNFAPPASQKARMIFIRGMAVNYVVGEPKPCRSSRGIGTSTHHLSI